MTKESAIALAETKWWETISDDDAVRFQLFADKLCMPFDEFHRKIEKVLSRPVWTHEFWFIENIQQEYLGERSQPTFQEILNLIPEEKRILILIEKEDG